MTSLDTENPYTPSSFTPRPARMGVLSLITLSLVAIASLAAGFQSIVTIFGLFVASLADLSVLTAGVKQLCIWMLIFVLPLWTYVVHKNLRGHVPDRADWKSGFAALAYFIPFANLFLPPVVMREIHRAYFAMSTRGTISAEDLKVPVPAISRWWGFYLTANIILLPSRFLDPSAQAILQVLSATALAISGFFLVRLVYAISRLRTLIRLRHVA